MVLTFYSAENSYFFIMRQQQLDERISGQLNKDKITKMVTFLSFPCEITQIAAKVGVMGPSTVGINAWIPLKNTFKNVYILY